MKTAVRQFRDKAISVLTAFALLISAFAAFSLNFRASAEEYVEMEIEDYRLWYMDSGVSEFVDVSATEDVITVKDGDRVKFYLKWLIPNNLENYDLQTEINSHGIKFDIPADGTLYYEGEAIGTYEVKTDSDGKTYFRASLDKDKVKDKSNISGGLIIDGVVALDEDGTIENGSEQQLGYGDKNVTVIYDDGNSNGNVKISKTGGYLKADGSGNYTIDYTVTVTITGLIDKATVTDVLPEGLSIKEDTLTVTDSAGNPVSFTDNSTENSIGSIVLSQVSDAGKNTSTVYNIKYTAKISKADLMEKYVNPKRNILNTAFADFIDEDGNPTTKQSTAPTDVSEPSVSKTVNTTKTSSFNNIIQVSYNGMQKYCRLIEYTIEIKTGYLGQLSEEDLKTVIKSLKDNFYNLNDTMWIPYSDKCRYDNNRTTYTYSLNQAPTYFSELIFEYKGDLSKITDDEFNKLINDHYCFNYSNGKYTINYKIIIIDDELNKKGLQDHRSFTNVVQADIEGKHFVVPVTLSELPGVNVLDKTMCISGSSLREFSQRGPDHNWYVNFYNYSGSLNSFKIDNSSGTPTLWIPWEITVNSDDLKLAYSNKGNVTLSDILGFVTSSDGIQKSEYIPGTYYSEPSTHYFDTEDFWDYFTIDGGHYSKQPTDTVSENKWSIDFTSQVKSIVNSSYSSHDFKIRYYSKLKLQDNGDGTYSIPSEFINKNLYNTSTIQEDYEPPYNDNYTLNFTSPSSTTKEPDTVHLTKGNISKSSKTISFAGDKITFTDGLSIGWRLGVPVSDITSKREHEDGSVSDDILTFVDTLPEGLKFNKDSLIAVYWTGSSSSTSTLKTLEECKLDNSCYTVAYDETERKITITFTAPENFDEKVKDLSAQRIEFFFRTDVDKEWLSENSDKSSYTFRNNATVNLNGDSSDSDNSTFTMNFPKVADKSGVIIDNIDEKEIVKDMRMRAQYTLEINPLTLDLNSKSNSLTIRDMMNAHLILLPETVQFIDGNTGEALSGAEYSFSYYPADENTVVFNIPDGTYVKIVYDTIIDVDPGEDPNWLKETDNKFTIDDVDLTNANDHTIINTFNGRVQAYVINETGSITISKYYVDDDGEHDLAGAGFMLYSVYDNFGKVAEEPMLSEPVIIPAEGSVVINDLPLDRIYLLKEVSAPEGFIVDEIGTYFMLTGDSGVTDPRTVVNPDAETKALSEKITAALGSDDIPEYEGSLASNVLKFLNIKEVTISGTKTWKGDSGYDVRPDDITLLLFANGKPYEGTYKAEWTKSGDEWGYSISGLPERDKDGNVITYTLEEDVPLDYAASVDKVSDTEINITNTFAPDKVIVKGTKTWVNDSEPVRPAEITLILTADGEEVEGAVPTWTKSDDKWTYEFSDLDKYAYTKTEGIVSKTLIEYNVIEIVPDEYNEGYSKRVEGDITIVDIVNTRITETEITKVDENGEPLSGATLVVTDKNGIEKDTWKTDGTVHVIKGLIAGETYYLSEKIAPDGYNKAKTIEFTVNSDGTVLEIEMTDTVTVTEISKTDEHGNFVPNAHLILKDENGDTVDEWDTEDAAHVVKKLTAGKTYTLVETSAPDGYIVAKEIQFTVKDGETTEVVMTDAQTETSITKTDEAGKPLAGAHLVVTDKNNKIVDEWDSTTEAHTIKGLVAGETYTITETVAPAGYAISKPQTFEVKGDGTVTVVTFGNDLTVTEVTKVDENNKPLAGAHLVVTDKNGNTVDEWDSTTEAHTIKGLVAGETYTITETSAPAGYAISKPQTFEVKGDGTVTVVTFGNDLTVTEVTKTDEAGKPLAGAHLVVTDKNDKTVDEWDTTTSAHTIKGLVAGETYTITETSAPAGYAISKPQTFEVKGDGTVTVVTFGNDLTVTEVIKTDEAGKPLAGAHLVVTDKNGNTVDEWDTTTGVHTITGLVAGETYTITETVAPAGYAISKPQTFEVKGDGTVTVVTFGNDLTVTEVIKTDEAGKPLAGAHLVVTDKNGTNVDEWDTTTSAHIIKGLVAGEIYTITETVAPAGYAISKPQTFEVKGDGTITVVTFDNDLTVTEVTKVDENNKPLAGAHLVVTDKNDKTVDEWDTTTSAHTIKGLVAGETYTITETVAPAGYAISKPQTFEVKGDGTVTVVTFGNDLTVTEVTKVDENNKPLAGAHLVVTDKNDKTVDEWDSTTEAHTIKGLVAGETYTITETSAPAGYAISKPQTFEVKGDGTVTVVTFGNTLTVTEVTKVDENNKPLAGAHLVVTDKNGNPVAEWDSTEEAHTIKGLVAGETYTITETVAPAGYSKTKPITFTVNADGSITEVTLSNALTVTQISKTDDEGNPLAGAHLIVKDKDGNILYEWDSTEESYIITGLTAGEKYTLTEVSAPDGYEIAPSIDFVVRVNGDVTIVVMEDSLKKASTPDTGVSGGAAVLAVLSGAAVVILSKKKKR